LCHRAQPIHGARILLAEDNLVNQQVAREFLEKSGFVVIQILDTDSIRQGIPRLLHAIGVSFIMDSEIPTLRQPPQRIPGIWIHRDALPSLILTDAVLDHHMIQAIQEKGIILITEK
jgi:CheY-like chemotaxis protein